MLQDIINVTALAANICVLLLTAISFNLTAVSNKIRFVSSGFSTSAFYGDTISITLENKTLHSISVSSVTLLKIMGDGTFREISLASFNDPIVIEGRHVSKITTDPYTYIDEIDSITNLHINSIIAVNSGTKILFVKPYKKAPLKKIKKAYKKHRHFEPLTVVRREFNQQIVSANVRYAVSVKTGENPCDWNTMLLTNYGFLDGTICGYNGFNTEEYDSAESLKHYLTQTFNILENDIYVHEIEGF